MSEEKTKAVAGTGGLQRAESSEVKAHRQIIEECNQAEAQLYASRGYGGYIKTEHLDALRAARIEAQHKLKQLTGANG